AGFGDRHTSSHASAVLVQKDGRIVLGGWTFDGGGPIDFGLARLNTDGSLDTHFGDGGRGTTDFGPGGQDQIYSLAIQKDGKIVAAGTTRIGTDPAGFALARYLPNGNLDRAFGRTGKVTQRIAQSRDEAARGVAIQKDGKIVTAGTAADPTNTGSLR